MSCLMLCGLNGYDNLVTSVVRMYHIILIDHRLNKIYVFMSFLFIELA